jgi:hypothetical protein
MRAQSPPPPIAALPPVPVDPPSSPQPVTPSAIAKTTHCKNVHIFIVTSVLRPNPTLVQALVPEVIAPPDGDPDVAFGVIGRTVTVVVLAKKGREAAFVVFV